MIIGIPESILNKEIPAYAGMTKKEENAKIQRFKI